DGPDVDQLTAVLSATGTPIVASGGIGDLADLLALAAIEVDGRELAGAIVGRAIYEGRFTVSEALEALDL
ncbi:MAG TPA: HisA/HisF-related TIM barrel protein, partial [Acidimicrobiia bacterium]|nr:HisA/HisF-related TIM barrel protein [Acidimicrobiia bacterium]